MKKRALALILAAAVLAGAGWLLFGRQALARHGYIKKARAAAVGEGVDPRLLTRASYAYQPVSLSGPQKESHIVEFSSDLAGLVYMVYLDPEDGGLWWLDELSGEGEYCIVTTLFRDPPAPPL